MFPVFPHSSSGQLKSVHVSQMLIPGCGPKLIPLAQQGHLSFQLSEQREWAHAKGILSIKELMKRLLLI